METITKKVVEINNTTSTFSKLIIAAKSDTCKKWESSQDKLCKYMSFNREIRLMERVSKSFGLNPVEYDNEPYGVFLDNIWREAKNYTISVISESENAINVSGIAQYVKNREAKKNVLFSITPGGSFYFHEGKEISEAKLNTLYPTPEKLPAKVYKGINQDKGKNWINGTQSY